MITLSELKAEADEARRRGEAEAAEAIERAAFALENLRAELVRERAT